MRIFTLTSGKTIIHVNFLFIPIIIASSINSALLNLAEIDETDKIVGTWVYQRNDYNKREYSKNKKLKKKKSGFTFSSNGSLTVREYSGSCCGCPPGEYYNYNGTWDRLTDSTLKVNYFDNKPNSETLLIINLTDTKLNMKTLEK